MNKYSLLLLRSKRLGDAFEFKNLQNSESFNGGKYCYFTATTLLKASCTNCRGPQFTSWCHKTGFSRILSIDIYWKFFEVNMAIFGVAAWVNATSILFQVPEQNEIIGSLSSAVLKIRPRQLPIFSPDYASWCYRICVLKEFEWAAFVGLM